jgi:hypothetical protein
MESKTPRPLWGPWKCQDVKELTEGWLGVRLGQAS